MFELCVLFINNLTMNDKGREALIKKEHDVEGYNFRIIYEMYSN